MKNFLKKGQTLVEYSYIMAILSVAILYAVPGFMGLFENTYGVATLVLEDIVGDNPTAAAELVEKIKTNRSGGGDDTNPGGHGNEDGYENPGKALGHSK